PARLGSFPSDALFDYRDRRPTLTIDQGRLGSPDWPEVTVEVLSPPSGPPLVLVGGPEPDLRWRTFAADIVELAWRIGAERHVGLGSVPGPLPHTRPVQVICTSSDDDVLERVGRPHEQVVVPASCQVALEAALRDAGLETLGLWARIPHYVAGEYPEAARALLEQFSAHLGTPVDLSAFDAQIADNRARLDVAAQGSEEVREHVEQLEQMYDAEAEAEREGSGRSARSITEEQVPSADDLAAEIERFLQGRSE
ncbi:MAG: PAC2 family protein, partial [Actinomycetota bacterium]